MKCLLVIASLGTLALGSLGCDSLERTPHRAVERRPAILASATVAPKPADAVGPRSAAMSDESRLVREFRNCTELCYDQSEDRPTDRVTCRLQCVYDVVPDARDYTQKAQQCLDALAGCLDPCDAIDRRTDAVTCRLQCEAVAKDCLEGSRREP